MALRDLIWLWANPLGLQFEAMQRLSEAAVKEKRRLDKIMEEKMSEIPETIWRRAVDAAGHVRTRDNAAEIIARAIHQEREDSAMRARLVMISRSNEQHMLGQLQMQERIVQAIREGN